MGTSKKTSARDVLDAIFARHCGPEWVRFAEVADSTGTHARRHAQQLASDVWDMDARVRKADQAIAEAKAWVSGSPLPPKPIITLKNKHPERTQAQMMGHLRAAEKFLQAEEGCA